MAQKESAPYKESDAHVPNPYDLTGTVNTTGIGSHQNLASASAVVEADKQASAKSVLDGEAEVVFAGDSVPSQEDQIESLEKVAKKKADEAPVVVGGPTPDEADAAETDGSSDSDGSADSDGSDSKDADSGSTASKDEEPKPATKTAAAKTTAAKSTTKN